VRTARVADEVGSVGSCRMQLKARWSSMRPEVEAIGSIARCRGGALVLRAGTPSGQCYAQPGEAGDALLGAGSRWERRGRGRQSVWLGMIQSEQRLQRRHGGMEELEARARKDSVRLVRSLTAAGDMDGVQVQDCAGWRVQREPLSPPCAPSLGPALPTACTT
jgi:hypothetical protein